VNSKEENSEDFVPITSKNSASGGILLSVSTFISSVVSFGFQPVHTKYGKGLPSCVCTLSRNPAVGGGGGDTRL
jgi:hypothetical protein